MESSTQKEVLCHRYKMSRIIFAPANTWVYLCGRSADEYVCLKSIESDMSLPVVLCFPSCTTSACLPSSQLWVLFGSLRLP